MKANVKRLEQLRARLTRLIDAQRATEDPLLLCNDRRLARSLRERDEAWLDANLAAREALRL